MHKRNSFCAFLARVKTYTHTKNYTCTFTGSHLRAVTDTADDNNAGHHSTTTSATYRQLTRDAELLFKQNIFYGSAYLCRCDYRAGRVVDRRHTVDSGGRSACVDRHRDRRDTTRYGSRRAPRPSRPRTGLARHTVPPATHTSTRPHTASSRAPPDTRRASDPPKTATTTTFLYSTHTHTHPHVD